MEFYSLGCFEKWSQKADETRQKKLEESFRELDSIQSDEVENQIPVKTEINKEIVFDKIKCKSNYFKLWINKEY